MKEGTKINDVFNDLSARLGSIDDMRLMNTEIIADIQEFPSASGWTLRNTNQQAIRITFITYGNTKLSKILAKICKVLE